MLQIVKYLNSVFVKSSVLKDTLIKNTCFKMLFSNVQFMNQL